MSEEDKLLLCEYIIETQLGEQLLNPLAHTLIRSGALTLNQIAKKTNTSSLDIKNGVTTLIKHNLIDTFFDSFHNVVQFKFNH